MELHLTRSELRRRVCANLGMSSAATAQVQSVDQLNDAIEEGNQETLTRRAWKQLQVRTRFIVQKDQQAIPFPRNTQAENCLDLAVWDKCAQCYIPMKRQAIGTVLRSDPLRDPGVDTSFEQAIQSMPRRWEAGPSPAGLVGADATLAPCITIWPPPDCEYELQLHHTINPQLVNDSDVSVIDGLCIVYYARGVILDGWQDNVSSAIQYNKFEKRIRELSGWQQAGQIISIDRDSTFSTDRFEGLEGAIPLLDLTTGRAPGV